MATDRKTIQWGAKADIEAVTDAGEPPSYLVKARSFAFNRSFPAEAEARAYWKSVENGTAEEPR